jgi:hypothetical protein
MLKAIFDVKGDKKEVNVDFFVKDYTFINHLKRSVNTQVKGSVQKNTILHLINKGNFAVVGEDNEVHFNGNITSSYNEESGVTTVNTDVIEISETLALDTIDSICCRLDMIEDEATSLHIRLQNLFVKESKLLEEKLVA